MAMKHKSMQEYKEKINRISFSSFNSGSKK